MTEDEYLINIEALKKEHENKLSFLDKEFALSNSNVKIGDIVEDCNSKISVEKIKFTKSVCSSFPECVYFGTILNKNGEKNKKGKKCYIYQSNIIKN